MTSLRSLTLPLRHMIRRPLYPAIALAILSLGLSAAIATFTYINTFSQSFPGVDPDGLVQLFAAEDAEPFVDLSFLDYLDYAEETPSFESLTAVQHYYAASVRHEEMTEVAFLEAVTGGYFRTMRTGAELGRLLTPEDDRLVSDQAAVISFEWWQTRYGGTADVLGKTLFLNYRPYTIVGIAPRDFVGSASDFRPHVWIPIAHFRDRYVAWDRQALDRDVPLVRVYGRLASGVRPSQASAELTAIALNLDRTYPRLEQTRNVRVEEATWIDPRTRIAESSTTRIMMLAATGFLLLVCANVANLLLAVFSTRKRAFALQAALGATPGRILTEIVGQNVFLSGLAGLIAVGVSVPLSRRLGSYFERPSVWGENVSRELVMDHRVIGFALLVAVMTGVIAASLPAFEVLRRGVSEVLKADQSGGRASGRILGLRVPRTRDLLVSAQVALAVVLLVVSGLVLKTLSAASDVDPGFEYAQLIGSHVSTSSTGVQPEGREQFFRDLEDRVAEEPWVRAATVSGNAPLSGHGAMQLRAEGRDEDVATVIDQVHVGFFSKLGIDVVEGRPFTVVDTAGGVQVGILNRPAALRLFPDQSPIGRRVVFQRRDGSDVPIDVVGVVGNVKVRDFLAPAEPTVYFPYAQQTYPTGSALLVTTNIPPAEAVPLLQRWLREYEPHLAIVNSITYRDVVRGALYTQRMNAELFTALALMGLILACAGIFSVVSLSVAARKREIGIRKAIGSTSGAINGLVVRQAMVPVVVGGLVGLVLAASGARLLASLLYGVEAFDLAVVGGGVGVLLVAALSAAWLPAFRASRMDAVSVLRTD